MKPVDIITYLRENFDGFSKRQRTIAQYLIENYDKAAYMTAAKLSETVNVSESTVVRFAAEIGFEGYQQMQKSLRQITMTQSTSIKRMEIASRNLSSTHALDAVLRSDIKMIDHTLSEIDKKQFDGAIDAITNAKNIYITGVRSAASLAAFAEFYFHLIFNNTKLLSSADPADMFEQILSIGKGDVIFGMSFPRYSKNIIKLLQYAHKRGATVISLTDSVDSPIGEISDFCLTARSDMDSFVDSLVAPLSVLNALIVALGMKKEKELFKTFEDLENIWDEYEVYDKE